MSRSILSLAIIQVALIALILSQTQQSFAADNSQATDGDAATCEAVAANPAAGVDACTRILAEEIRASGRRQATALTYRSIGSKAKSELENAVRDLTEAISLAPDFWPAFEARADLLRENGQCDLATADYDVAIKLQSERAPLVVNRGLCLLATEQGDRALADFDRTIELDKDNAAGLAVLAWTLKAGQHLAKNDFAAAITDYDAAIKLNPKLAGLYVDRGTAWLSKGDESKALSDYDQAIEINKTGEFAVRAWTLKATLHAGKGEPDKAISDIDEALKADPQRAALYVDRANLWNGKGDRQRARADFDKAIEVEPKNAASYLLRGDFNRDTDQYDSAVGDYSKAIELQSDLVQAYGGRALARFYGGDIAKSADDFKRVVDDQPNAYSTLMLYLARARDGRKDAASELGKTAGKLKPAEWPYPIVDLYLGKKSLKETEAAAKTPAQKCEVQFYVGEWHLIRKDRSEATKALQSAVDSCPKDYVEYRGAVEELKRLK